MRTETARQEERIQNKARLPIGGNRQRYLFRGRFLCKHFSSRSLFSHASGLAEAGRAVPGSPAALRTENLLQSGLWRALCDRPFCVYRTCLPFVQPLLSSVQPLRVSTLSSSFSLPSITQPTNQPTNQIPLYHSHTPHKHRTPHLLARRNPRSRTLGSETRHPRTDKPARVARCCCAALHSICFNGQDNACLYSFARDKYLLHHRPLATVYGRVLLALT